MVPHLGGHNGGPSTLVLRVALRSPCLARRACYDQQSGGLAALAERLQQRGAAAKVQAGGWAPAQLSSLPSCPQPGLNAFTFLSSYSCCAVLLLLAFFLLAFQHALTALPPAGH